MGALEGARVPETEVEAGSWSFQDPNTEPCFSLRLTRGLDTCGFCLDLNHVIVPPGARGLRGRMWRDRRDCRVGQHRVHSCYQCDRAEENGVPRMLPHDGVR